MSTVICFDAAAQRAHQNRMASADAAQASINASERLVRDTLQFQMLASMAMGEGNLPLVQRGQCGRRDREITQPLFDAVIECLDHYETSAVLLKVLAESECPLVKELRLSIADRYVKNNAAELAALRCEE